MMERDEAPEGTAGDAPAAAERLAKRLLTWTAFILAGAIVFSLSFMPLRTSHDEFWHLKTGQWIVQHGALPKNDIFTYTAENIPWHNHEWLTQMIMWKLYTWGEAGREALWGGSSDLGGWGAVILAKTLLILLAYAGLGLLLGRRMRQPVWAALAAAVCAALARRTFYPRPPVVTYFLLGLTLWLLIEWRAGRLRGRWLWLLAPLFALWSNLHGGWLAGLIVLGAFWTDAVAGFFLQFSFPGLTGPRNPQSAIPPDAALKKNAIFLTVLGAACALATLANPFGYHLWELPFTVMKDRYLATCIGEMQPPDWYFVWAIEGLMLTLAAAAIRPVRGLGFSGTAAAVAGLAFLLPKLYLLFHYPVTVDNIPGPAAAWAQTAAALAIFGAAILRLRPRGWVAHLLLVAFFAQQGIHHVRHLTLLGVVLLPTLAWSLEAWAAAWAAAGGAARLPRREALAAAAGCGALAVLGGWWVFGWGWGLVAPREAPQAFYNVLLLEGAELQPEPYPGSYPVRAVNFLERARLPGRLWNGGNYAGYLIWRLAPEKYKLFTDNRYDIYGGRFIRQEHSVAYGWDQAFLAPILAKNPKLFAGQTPPDWNTVLDEWGVQTVFIEHEAGGNLVLARGGWVCVWNTRDFNIWVRDTPRNKEAIARALQLARS